MSNERKNSGTKNPEIRAYETAHKQTAQKAAEEGFVLLKNEDNFLPIQKECGIALFGAGATQTVKGGTGSGNVFCRHIVSIYEGFLEAGITVTNSDWVESFEKIYEESREAWKKKVWEKADSLTEYSLEGPMFTAYLSTPYEIPAGNIPTESTGETAVFVLSRKAGEGADRRLEGGDYYISSEEYDLLSTICRLYKNVILIINTGGAIDMSFTDDFPQIRSILYITQPGQEGGHAVARILLGEVSPSGKMSATWPLKYDDIPFSNEYSNLNGNLTADYCTQGIYVGYRYFDTFKKPVRYGFGSGLSYTEFSIHTNDIRVQKETVSVSVCVKNTGETFSGKEVVQLYVSCPQGTIPKEYRRLSGFEKTEELKPGEEQKLEITFSLNANCHWKNFDFSMLWTGADHVSRTLNGYFRAQFGSTNSSALTQWVADNSWTEDNRNASLPRISNTNKTHNNRDSQAWMIDSKYIRLKNVEIGYTFNKANNLPFFNYVRIFASGQNLLTFSKFDGNDPEAPGSGLDFGVRYPMTRLFNMGVQLNF